MGSMNLVKPTEGGSSGVWDTLINTLIDLVEEHTHETNKGVKVPAAGLNIDGDVAWGENGITNMGVLGFAELASSSVARSLFFKTDHECYIRNSSGVDIQVTSGSGLNMALSGGITGDYTTTDATLEYSDSTKAYQLLQDASPSDVYAKLKTGDVHLFKQGGSTTYYVEMKAPTLAATYTLTYPTALPGSGTSLVTLTSAGVLSHTVTPSVTTVTASGAIRSTAGDVRGATLTSDADVKHGSMTLVVSATAGAGTFSAGFTNGYITSGGAEHWLIPIPLHVSDVIASVVVDHDSAGNTLTFDVFKATEGTETSLDSAAGGGAGWAQVTLNSTSLPYTIESGYVVYVYVTTDGAGTDIRGITVTYSRA